MNITNAQYVNNFEGQLDHIEATIDGIECAVPISTGNRHYVAIKEKHDDPDDSFTIQDAE